MVARLRRHFPNKAALAASATLAATSMVQLVVAAVAFSQGTAAQCEAALAHPVLLAVQLTPPIVLVVSLVALAFPWLCRRGPSSTKVAVGDLSGVVVDHILGPHLEIYNCLAITRFCYQRTPSLATMGI
jgi:hypothetical protein